MIQSPVMNYFLQRDMPTKNVKVLEKQTKMDDYFLPMDIPVRVKIPKNVPVFPVKQAQISDYFVKSRKIVRGYNSKTNSWHCTECGEDMGPENPRQLCGKWHCRNV
jgi:hypothetical protein